jgi:hypothetical protein
MSNDRLGVELTRVDFQQRFTRFALAGDWMFVARGKRRVR